MEKLIFNFSECECHICHAYGFVPEADCPVHDTEEFAAFVKALMEMSKKATQE